MGAIEPLEPLLRLAAATLCGGLIGLERELHGKPVALKAATLEQHADHSNDAA